MTATIFTRSCGRMGSCKTSVRCLAVPGSRATAINDSGQVVGYSYDDVSGNSYAFLWQNGRMQNLGMGAAYGINDNGQVVGDSQDSSGSYYAFLWENGVTQDIVPGGVALGINSIGQVVGGARNAVSGQSMAFLWQNNSVTALGLLPGGYYSWATGINDSAQVVGYACDANWQPKAFLYQDGTMQDLGTLPGGNGIADGINDSGQVVGGGSHDFVWQNGIVTDLGEGGGAYGINNEGWICGEQNGSATLWQPVPEPASFLALLCGMTGLCGVAWRWRR